MADTPATHGCALCGLPVRGDDSIYCCSGCEHVDDILKSAGYKGDPKKSRQYIQALQSGLVAGEAQSEEPTEKAATDTTYQKEFACEVDGMWCASCAWLVEETLTADPGIIGSSVSFVTDRGKITYDPQVTSPEKIRKRIQKLGYDLKLSATSGKRRGPLLRFGVAAFFTANVMVLSYSLYAHSFWQAPAAILTFLPWLLAALAAPVVFGAGFPILNRAFRATLSRAVTMDTLIAIGSLSAYGYSLIGAFRGDDHVYFDSACALITFWLLGRLIEASAFARAEAISVSLKKLLPKKVRLVEETGTRWIPATDVSVGDRIRVAAGERCPVDGTLLSERAVVSTAVVDGEPVPRHMETGQFVPGGSAIGDGGAELEVLHPAKDSILARVAEHAVTASGKPRDRMDTADALARLFLPLVFILTAVTFALAITGNNDVATAFERALTVLVVSCPCAMGLAAPLARVIASGVLMRRGVLVRDEGTLDDMATADAIAFDKTGTLTVGRFELSGIRINTENAVNEESLLGILAALERGSAHPIARAVAEHTTKLTVPAATKVEHITGRGVRGQVGGHSCMVGNRAWIEETGETIPADLIQFATDEGKRGFTTIFVAQDAEILGAVSFGDELRPGAPSLVDGLKGQGLGVHILSGDGAPVVNKVGRTLGIDKALSDMTPTTKADWLKALEEERGRRPIFVGDGINDAPALASAVGIAVASGTDFAKETAAILLLEKDPDVVPFAIGFSRRMRRTIHQNLGWAALYNAVSIPAAMLGLLTPIIAAAAMVTSGLIVTLNTLRLLKKSND